MIGLIIPTVAAIVILLVNDNSGQWDWQIALSLCWLTLMAILFILTTEEENSGSEFSIKFRKSMNISMMLGVVAGIVGVIGLWVAGNYNYLVATNLEVDNAWAAVETQYQRRFDLIDNLVASVKGAQKQELAVLKEIADARKVYNGAQTQGDKVDAINRVETSVAMLQRLQEAYPDIKSNEQVQSLMSELVSTEDVIGARRDNYNQVVTNYNLGVSSFPKNMFASFFGFEKRKLFESVSGAEQAVRVNFE